MDDPVRRVIIYVLLCLFIIGWVLALVENFPVSPWYWIR